MTGAFLSDVPIQQFLWKRPATWRQICSHQVAILADQPRSGSAPPPLPMLLGPRSWLRHLATSMKSLASKFRSVSSAIRARSQQGIENLADAEAEAIVAKDRVSHGRDLLNAIEAGDFPLAPLRRPPEERH
jgi:hypothetical protein